MNENKKEVIASFSMIMEMKLANTSLLDRINEITQIRKYGGKKEVSISFTESIEIDSDLRKENVAKATKEMRLLATAVAEMNGAELTGFSIVYLET